jgi:hypothetical protein
LINDNTVADQHKQLKEFAKGDYLLSRKESSTISAVSEEFEKLQGQDIKR